MPQQISNYQTSYSDGLTAVHFSRQESLTCLTTNYRNKITSKSLYHLLERSQTLPGAPLLLTPKHYLPDNLSGPVLHSPRCRGFPVTQPSGRPEPLFICAANTRCRMVCFFPLQVFILLPGDSHEHYRLVNGEF